MFKLFATATRQLRIKLTTNIPQNVVTSRTHLNDDTLQCVPRPTAQLTTTTHHQHQHNNYHHTITTITITTTTTTTTVNTTTILQDEAASRTTLNGTAPFNVPLTLPPSEQPQMYAVLLEVHDTAGNVAYARRFVFYDNSSRLLAYEDKALTVVSAGETGWQTRLEDVCVSWKGRYYNEAFLHFNFLLPVKRDEARGIEGVYEENSDLLSASGTASVRGVVSFEVRVLYEQLFMYRQ